MAEAFFRRAFEDDFSAISPGPRSHLHKMVRRHDHVAVMFDHDDGIAEVAQVVD